MTGKITRRVFIKQAAFGLFAASLDPFRGYGWFRQEFSRATATPSRARSGFALARPFGGSVEQKRALIPDDKIPTQFFTPGYTLAQLEEAWQNGDLVSGFPYGLMDTHTVGGVPDTKNVTIDESNGSAVLSIRHLTAEELEELQAVPWKKDLMDEGTKNGLDMQLSMAAFFGRLPTDTRSIEANITLPRRFQTDDPNAGMVGINWSLWTIPDIDRLAANLADLGVPEDENKQICSRIFTSNLEEDIAEMSIAEPSLVWGDPFVLKLIGGHILLFMAGRKTPTQKYAKADIMHVLREPLSFTVPAGLTQGTIRGWLAQNGENSDQALKRPLRVRMDIGAEVYDPTRDAMVVPMSFRLNDILLTPMASGEYPGFEQDKGGNTTPNLSIWRIRTRQGDWVTIPRQFIINFGSINRPGRVWGEKDEVRFSNVVITRQSPVASR